MICRDLVRVAEA